MAGMRLTVVVGAEKLRIPVDEGSKTIAWLQAQIVKRWEKLHKGDFLHIGEIRTRSAQHAVGCHAAARFEQCPFEPR